MDVYSVGPDELLIPNDDGYLWCVYYYHAGDWCGDGEAVAFRLDGGAIETYNLSHCSCNDPFDDWGKCKDVRSVEQFLLDQDSVRTDTDPSVFMKVKELLRENLINQDFGRIMQECETAKKRAYNLGKNQSAADAYAFGHYEGFQYARANPNAVILNPPKNPIHKYEVKYKETE